MLKLVVFGQPVFIAFRGATMYEMALGPLCITLHQPRFMRRGTWPWLRFGWEQEWKR